MKTPFSLVTITLLAIQLAASCSKSDKITSPVVAPPVTIKEELIFNSGFEAGSYMVSTGAQTAEFRGMDATYPQMNDWTAFPNHSNVGYFRIYYEQGDSSQRLCSIVSDPVSSSNKVMNYKIKVPHIDVAAGSQYSVNGILFDKKGRIQADLYGNNGLKEIYQSIRLFLPADFNKLVNSAYPGNGDWITLAEFWNNEWWSTGAKYPFRFGIGLDKGTAAAGSPLYFKTDGQILLNNKITTVWGPVKNTSYPVPIDKWFTMEYYIKEGNKGSGRFYLAVTPDNGTKTVIWDINNDTCSPDDSNPDGLSEFNPIKLYTSNNMINQMNKLGGTFQCYWDDFKLWKNKKP